MLEYQLVALVPNAICILLGLYMGLKVYRKAPSDHRPCLLSTFILIVALATIWGVERFIADEGVYMVLVVLEYAFEVSVLVSILCFSLKYTGYGRYVNRRSSGLLLVLGAAITLLNATNGMHHLFYESLEIVDSYGLHMMQAVYGPLFILWMVYSVGLLLLIMGILLKGAWEAVGAKRVGTVLIVIGVGFYTSMGVLFALIERDPRLDLLTIGLVVASVLVYEADRRSNIIDQYRITIREAIHAMDDGVVIVSPDQRVVYLNDKAKDLVKGENLDDFIDIPVNDGTDILLSTPSGDREFNVMRSSIEREGVPIGDIIVLRDVTERKGIERQLAVANRRLGTMGKVLRHDLMNEMTVLHGNLELLGQTKLNDVQMGRLEKAAKACIRINEMVDMTHEQHIDDHVSPTWQDLASAIMEGTRNMDLNGIKLTLDTLDYQVLADPMLPTVFNNLMDNSIRHGGEVRNVSVRVEGAERGVHIIWEDDGRGVPLSEKGEIFKRGYGKHTGMGLFFIKEILNMTGSDIYEDGEPGKGARFVISVPSIACRMVL